MRHLKKKQFHNKIRFWVPYIVPIIFIGVFMLGILGFLLLNTTGLGSQLQNHILIDGDNVAVLQADNISARMGMRKKYIVNLADTFSKMPEYLLTEELLERKGRYLEMDRLFVMNCDDFTDPKDVDMKDVKAYWEEHPEMREAPQIFYTGHEKIFFSAPILRENSENNVFLIGTRSNSMLQEMLQAVDLKNHGISCILDRDGTVIVKATDETPFLKLYEIFHENQEGQEAELQRVREEIREHRSGTAKLTDKNGESIMLCYDFLNINDWIMLTIIPMNLFSAGLDAYMTKYIVAVAVLFLALVLTLGYIIWSNFRSMKKIQTVAFRDSLTGGMNNQAFLLEGEKLMADHPQRNYAIVYLNIREFKQFNERFGVKTGDNILLTIHDILQNFLSEEELMARCGSDQFCLLLRCKSEEDVLQWLDIAFTSIEKLLSGQFLIDRSSIAQGAYLIPKKRQDIRIMQDRAKMASTYQLDTKLCRFYDNRLSQQKEREQWLTDSFSHALETHEFKLYVQPKVSPKENQIRGGEVLVRWENSKYGLLFPGDFIGFLEKNGKICELDFYMFEESCRILKQWLAERRAVPLSVNLSRAHLNSENLEFLNRLKEIKDSYGIPDGLIELELTESLMLERKDIRLAINMIDQIRSMGFLCSMDDFGFGYSSLSLLKDLNVNTVKLDRQFFLNQSEKSWIVVRQLIRLAHYLGMTVVAEGIEEVEQVERLGQCHCDLIQGYVYAKPMPVLEFQKSLEGSMK